MAKNAGTINLIYFSKFIFHLVASNSQNDVEYDGIYKLPYYISHHNLIDYFDTIIMNQAKPKKMDGKKFLRDLVIECNDELENSEEYVLNRLKGFVNEKYEEHISIKKSANTLSYFEVLNKIFDITDDKYVDKLFEPFMNLYYKISQFRYWRGESDSIISFPEDVVKDQIIIAECVIMFNLFDGAVMLDNKDSMPIELDFDSHYSSWETALSSLISKIDPFLLDTQIDMYLSMIQLYMEFYWNANDELIKKTKGGQSNLIEANLITEMYKELKVLKEKNGIEIEIIEMEEDPLIYPATRDQWVNSLRNDLVDILNIIYKARGHHKRLKKYDSPETIRALALKVEKEKDKIEEILNKY